MNAVQQHTAARTDVAATPAGLKCELRPVQQRALAFMLSRERDVDGAPKDFARLPTPGGHSVYYGRTAFCLRRPASGGFLMQEMGIGKTVEALALVLANPRPLDDPDAPLGTLVVCPTTLLANWKSEIEKLMPRRTRWLVLNSAAKKAHDTPSKLSRYHVVVTSYTLLSGSPALKAKWRRVIFDESQTVKEIYTVQARAAEQIIAPFRWALSGTPMPKDVGDLKGQLNVLQTFPFYGSALGDSSNRFEARLLPGPGNKAWAESRWGGESEGKLSEGKASGKADKIKGTAGAQEQPVLRFLCDFAFRSTIEGESLGLPPLTIANELLEPSEADAEQLAAVRASVAEQVARLERAQALEYRMPLLHSLLMRLRLACDHPSLAIDALQRMRELSEQARAEGEKLSVPEVRLDVVLKEAKPKPILHNLDQMVAPTLTPCSRPHLFCLSCLLDSMQASHRPQQETLKIGKCPICRTQMTSKELRRVTIPAGIGVGGVVVDRDVVMAEAEAETKARLANAPRSAKIDALVTALKAAICGGERSVVFTHFLAFQKLCSERLTVEGITHVQILGSSSQSERAKALASFTKPGSGVKVFLLSMRSASVGLTLTAASRLFLMEPAISLASEQQAIGRLHRFGQTKPVHVVRYALQGTVEEKILTMHDAAEEPAGDSPVAEGCGSPSSSSPGASSSSSPTTVGASSPGSSTAASPDKPGQRAQQAMDLPTLRRLLA